MPEPQDAIHQVDYESEHITFRSIWHAAVVLRDNADKDESSGFWSLMAAGVLAYTAYEGFVNDLIERAFPAVWKERRSQLVGDYRGTLGKTLFVAERLSVVLQQSDRPYCTLAELHAWRNDLVHPQTVRVEGVTRADAYAKKPIRAKAVAFAKLEQPTFIPRVFEDVPALGDLLLQSAAREHWAAVSTLGSIAFSGVLGSSGASLRE